MKLIKNKKANLMENSTELVIAILILLILFVAVVKIYTNFLQDRELTSAKNVVNVIEQKILDASENSNVKKTIRGVNGEDWVLTAFDFSSLNRPDACFEQPCIYICKTAKRLIKDDCEDKGVFRRLEVDEIKTIELDFSEDWVGGGGVAAPTGSSFKNSSKINLPQNKLLELEIEKKTENGKKKLIITHYTDEYLANKDKLKNG